MAHVDGGQMKRPEHVIILDADDPMTEIHGRVVWQEEHDRVVDEVRAAAFNEGYAAAQRDAQQQAAPQTIRLRIKKRRTILGWSRLAALITVLLVVLIMLPLVLKLG